MERLAAVRTAFAGHYWRPVDRVVRAPGRVNLIGEHTDYNDGFVLPMDIERDVLIAFSARQDRQVVLHSLDFGEDATFPLDDIRRDEEHSWSNYARGVARELEAGGVRLRGIDAVMQGNVPIGAGLSSSAAFEVAMALALLSAAGTEMERAEVARVAQRAENRFVGMQCGIMDQFVSALGQAGHALFIDCRDLSYRAVPMPPGSRVVICDTMTRRGLVGSAYNERRRQSEEAVRLLSGVLPGIRALRDVAPEDLARHGDLLPPVLRRRAGHVVGENARVLAAAQALEAGQAEAFGLLMDASHESLRHDYEVSSPALDLMVELARQVPGCLGSRMTGAGFGGATVSLVRNEAVPRFVASVADRYERRMGLEPEITVTAAAAGAGVLA